MKTNLHLLEDIFKNATLEAFPELKEKVDTFQIEITKSTSDLFGAYQFNSCMKLSRLLQKNPRDIALCIEKQVKFEDMIDKVEIKGPGFINIFLNSNYLAKRLDLILNDPYLGIEKSNKKKKIILDFSSPNTAKEMHVGHLRSTIIGDSLARLFEFMGEDVLRLNHIGDWGTAFGMLIAYMKLEAKDVIEKKATIDLPGLMQLYKLAKVKFDHDLEFKKQSQLEVVSLQSGDPTALSIWELICDISRKGYQEIYDLLDIKIEERGESFYNPMLKDLVIDLEKRELVEVSDGAKCIFLEGFQNREGAPLPLMIQKSDGGFNYDTTDMAAIRHRIQEEKADRIIYVTDAGQATHFEMIIKAAEKAGYLDPKKVKVDHVGFGLVLGPDGKKFKTRSGETEKLIDLIFTAIKEAEKILKEKNPDMDDLKVKELAKALGIGAIKYADLSCNRVGDYTFSYERMLRFEGNTAAFLMYSYVRIISIMKKVHEHPSEKTEETNINLEHPSELSLSLHLSEFPETIQIMERDLLPNRLTDYLYNLAEKFNAFYRDCPVIGSKEQNSRVKLSEAVLIVMKKGFEILGLPVIEKM